MTLMTIDPGVKICAQVNPDASDDDLAFVRQTGVEWAVCWTGGDKASADYYRRTKKRFAEHGLRVFGFGNRAVHNQDAIVLGLENRDAKIEEYKAHLRALGDAEIPYTTYAHMANGIWSTEREATRGGAPARGFDFDKAEAGHWDGELYHLPLTHNRAYSENEIWDNFAYFAERIVPVAEEAGVRIGIHPDDPPGLQLGGVPRCIFSTFDGYQRALATADSPNVGICLCVGCWLEGGDAWGKGPIEAIRKFAEQGKLFKVHFRNVDAPLPHFVETFIDNGYADMYPIMRTLEEVGFNGIVIPDHIPTMGGEHKVGTAYTLAYMRAWHQRAQAELAVA